jgi:hypothetical protein
MMVLLLENDTFHCRTTFWLKQCDQKYFNEKATKMIQNLPSNNPHQGRFSTGTNRF